MSRGRKSTHSIPITPDVLVLTFHPAGPQSPSLGPLPCDLQNWSWHSSAQNPSVAPKNHEIGPGHLTVNNQPFWGWGLPYLPAHPTQSWLPPATQILSTVCAPLHQRFSLPVHLETDTSQTQLMGILSSEPAWGLLDPFHLVPPLQPSEYLPPLLHLELLVRSTAFQVCVTLRSWAIWYWALCLLYVISARAEFCAFVLQECSVDVCGREERMEGEREGGRKEKVS